MSREPINLLETLDRVDVIDMAEKMEGKSFEEMSKEAKLGTIAAVAQLGELKRLFAEKSGDTHLSSQADVYEQILLENGFQLAWMSTRKSSSWGYKEREALYAKPNGLVVYAETFGSTKINTIKLFAEYEPTGDPTTASQLYYSGDRICSGGGSFGFRYGLNDRNDPIETKPFTIAAHVNSGLKWKLEEVEKAGKLNPVWTTKDDFRWILNYDEEKEITLGEKEWLDILKRKVGESTLLLRTIMGCYL